MASVPYAAGFEPPSLKSAAEAVGSFPCPIKTDRMKHQPSDEYPRPSLALAAADLDKESYYREPASGNDMPGKKKRKKSNLFPLLPPPKREEDWLANYVEDGQSFEEYVELVATRSGRFKSSHFGGLPDGASQPGKREAIGLVPIIRISSNNNIASSSSSSWAAPAAEPSKSAPFSSWPSHGPDLEELRHFTEIFFDRPVKLLPPATVALDKGGKRSTEPGGFAKQKLLWCHSCTGAKTIRKVRVHTDSVSTSKSSAGNSSAFASMIDGEPRLQIHVEPILDLLANLSRSDDPPAQIFTSGSRSSDKNNVGDNKIEGQTVGDCYCIMGVTMEDLYSHASDLFVAGMAAGGSNVAVFSFHRYHPRLRMSPETWFDYGYASKASEYPYFPDPKIIRRGSELVEVPAKRPTTTPLPFGDGNSVSINTASKLQGLSTRAQSTMLRRSVKLLVHELLHIYGVDHCVYHSCVMQGTGNLVEDFGAPLQLCPVDLRKLAWRTGCSVAGRFTALLDFYNRHQWKEDVAWTKQWLSTNEHQSTGKSCSNSNTSTIADSKKRGDDGHKDSGVEVIEVIEVSDSDSDNSDSATSGGSKKGRR